MKKLLALLLVLGLLLAAVPSLAENGEAEFSFEGTTYHVTYTKSEIVDGKLNVAVSGFGSTLPFRNGKIIIIAWAAVVIDGQEIRAESVSAGGDGTYTYLYDTTAMPDQVVIYAYEDDSTAIPLWQADEAAE